MTIRYKKPFLSRKFYVGRPFSVLEPAVELAALNVLKDALLQREEYEKVQLVQNRINEVTEEMKKAQQPIVYTYGAN